MNLDGSRGSRGCGQRERGRGTRNAVDAFSSVVPVRGRGNVGAMPNVVASGSGRGSYRGIVRDKVPARARGRGRRGGQVIVDDFVQATSSNLPVVSCFTVADYYQSLLSSELRQSKDQM